MILGGLHPAGELAPCAAFFGRAPARPSIRVPVQLGAKCFTSMKPVDLLVPVLTGGRAGELEAAGIVNMDCALLRMASRCKLSDMRCIHVDIHAILLRRHYCIAVQIAHGSVRRFLCSTGSTQDSRLIVRPMMLMPVGCTGWSDGFVVMKRVGEHSARLRRHSEGQGGAGYRAVGT